MHSRFDKSRTNEDGFFEKWGFGFVVLPVLLAIAMITLSIVQPKNSNGVAESLQAEFAARRVNPTDAPTQATKPAMQTRTVNAK